MKLSKVHIFIKIIFPEALPYISAGIRLALSFSVVAVIVSEMLVSTKYGLGRKIIDYQLLYESSKMYAVVILTGVLGYIINHFYLILEKNKIHWMGK
jgi:NitT/TauT family transport system permease protein